GELRLRGHRHRDARDERPGADGAPAVARKFRPSADRRRLHPRSFGRPPARPSGRRRRLPRQTEPGRGRAGRAGAPARRAIHPVIRVLLVDDSPSVRAVLRRFLSRTEDLVVVGDAEDGERAVAAVVDLQPDVVVMDLQMPVMDGLVAIERIMARRPTPILVLSSRANRNQMQTAFEAMKRGAIEVLPKPEDTGSWQQLAESLPEVVRAAAAA